MEFESLKPEETSRPASLLDLIRLTFDSGYSYEAWKVTDCTASHLIMISILMICSCILQLVGFTFAVVDLVSHDFPQRSSLVFEPYIECLELFIILLLVHLQFFAFFKDGILVLKIISKDLRYTNITATLIFTSFITSEYIFYNNFSEIYEILSGSFILVLYSWGYYRLYSITSSARKIPAYQLIGFNILHSFSIPYLLLEVSDSIVQISISHRSLAADRELVLSVLVTLYFLAGSLALYLLTDVYLGIGIAVNLFGAFIVQTEQCFNDGKECKPATMVCAFIYAVCVTMFVIIIMHFYPYAYLYRFKNRHSIYIKN